MGTYHVKVEATGGHGCQREYGDGERVLGCRRMNCPDCIVQEFVEKLHAAGQSSIKAELIHWPGQESEVRDEFVMPSEKVESYEKSEYRQPENGKGEYVKTGEIAHYVDKTPMHRIRHGSFPK